MHDAGYLKEHPDATPVGTDGRPCPAPDGWQGVCPTHPGYRAAKMEEFRRALADHDIDGIRLDYHHAHASWEQAKPNMPDTCFCDRCLDRFVRETKIDLPAGPTLGTSSPTPRPTERGVGQPGAAESSPTGSANSAPLRDATRPTALLGTFHCPWTNEDFDGALREKLAIDLKAASGLPRRAQPDALPRPLRPSRRPRLDHASDRLAGRHLNITGKAGERLKIWPIVQLSDCRCVRYAEPGESRGRLWDPAPADGSSPSSTEFAASGVGQGRKNSPVLSRAIRP